MNLTKNEPKGGNYLGLALFAFAGLGMEVLYAYLLEPLIYGCGMEEWNTIQTIMHWIITCITWIIVGILIIKNAKRKYDFDIFQKVEKNKLWKWILTGLFVILALVSSYIDWNGSKVLHEFQSRGMLLFIFQYIYYLVETFLFMLIIVFGQLAFEQWFKKPNIPYGGIVVALTWGLAHWLSKGSFYTGIYTAIAGFGFGVVYLLLNRNIKWTYIVLCIMFIL